MVLISLDGRAGPGQRASHRPGDVDRAAGLEHDDPHLRRELGGVRDELAGGIGRCRGGRCSGRCPSGSARPSRVAASRAPRPPRAGPCGPGPTLGPQPATGISATSRRAGQARPSPGTAPCRPRSRRRAATKPTALGWLADRHPPAVVEAAPTARARTPCELDLVPGVTVRTRCPDRPQRPAGVRRRQHRRRPVEAAQRTQVEVVVVAVRDQQRRRARPIGPGARHLAAADGPRAIAAPGRSRSGRRPARAGPSRGQARSGDPQAHAGAILPCAPAGALHPAWVIGAHPAATDHFFSPSDWRRLDVDDAAIPDGGGRAGGLRVGVGGVAFAGR